jgi:hypothetical protein
VVNRQLAEVYGRLGLTRLAEEARQRAETTLARRAA